MVCPWRARVADPMQQPLDRVEVSAEPQDRQPPPSGS